MNFLSQQCRGISLENFEIPSLIEFRRREFDERENLALASKILDFTVLLCLDHFEILPVPYITYY